MNNNLTPKETEIVALSRYGTSPEDVRRTLRINIHKFHVMLSDMVRRGLIKCKGGLLFAIEKDDDPEVWRDVD